MRIVFSGLRAQLHQRARRPGGSGPIFLARHHGVRAGRTPRARWSAESFV